MIYQEYADLVDAFVRHLGSRATRAKRRVVNRRFSESRLHSHPAVVNICDDVRLMVYMAGNSKTWNTEFRQKHGWSSGHVPTVEQRLRSAIVMAKRMRPSMYDHLAEIVPGGPEFEAILTMERLA